MADTLDTGIITSGMRPQNFAMAVEPFPEVSNVAAMQKASTLASGVMDVEEKQKLQNDNNIIQEALKNGADFDTPEGMTKLLALKGSVTPTTYQNLLKMRDTADERKLKLA